MFDDLDRFFEHLIQFEVADAPMRIDEIVRGMQILTYSPLIGRPVKGGMRELGIGRGSRGHVALYRLVVGVDMVFVLAIRGKREVDFRR